MKRKELSVAMIVKNEEDNIVQALDSINEIADEIIIVDTGSTDKTIEYCRSYPQAVIFEKTFNPFHFGEARNYSFSKCTGDWILWIDADDIVENPEGIKELIKRDNKLVNGYSAIYNYAFDKSGLCTSRHWKERLVKNDGSLKWEGVIHEAMTPNREVNILKTDKFSIKHCKDDADWKRSSQRNYNIVRTWVNDNDLDAADPRNILHLANALLGLGEYDQAFQYFEEFTTRSGWDAEIYIALHRMAVCARALKKYEVALNCEFQALTVDPKVRDAYIGIGQTYMELEKWEKAEHWLKLSFSKETQKEAQIHNPSEYSFNPWWFLAHVYTNMAIEGAGEEYVDAALKCFAKCKGQMAEDEEIAEKVNVLLEAKENNELAEAVLKVGSYLKDNKESMATYVEIVPPAVAAHPAVWKMRNSINIKEGTSGKDLAIFCGNCFEAWDPTYIDTGVGGSEEAVIHMARELSELGWNVEVFNNVTEKKEFDGVVYKPWYAFNPEDEYDVFIGWRQPALFDALKPNAKKTYLWLHDVVKDGEFTPDRLAKIDKVFVLSEYHRSLFPSIPDDKIWLSANGLHLEHMNPDVSRKEWKIINTSAPDRGLLTMLTMWPEIKKKYPKAEFHWFYGWQTYDNYNSGNPERMKYKEKIQKLFEELPDVYDRGRVGHVEIAEEMASSDIWAYPTEFPEISCISAMKAQALGCVPVVTNVAALKETVKEGIKLDYEDIYSNKEAQKAFIDALGEASKQDRGIIKQAGRQFSWKNVAKDWSDKML